MRALNEAQNINPSDADFVNGSTRNDVTGGAEGTIFSEELMGDLVQTIQKLISLNGLTPNSLKDNETNKHQLLAALFQEGLPEWRSTTSNVLFDTIKFVRYGDAIYFHKTTTNTTTPPDTDTTNWIKVLEYNNVNDRFSFNEYDSGWIEFDTSTADSRFNNLTVRGRQRGNTVTISANIDMPSLSGSVSGHLDMAIIPTQISRPSVNVYSAASKQFGDGLFTSRIIANSQNVEIYVRASIGESASSIITNISYNV